MICKSDVVFKAAEAGVGEIVAVEDAVQCVFVRYAPMVVGDRGIGVGIEIGVK